MRSVPQPKRQHQILHTNPTQATSFEQDLERRPEQHLGQTTTDSMASRVPEVESGLSTDAPYANHADAGQDPIHRLDQDPAPLGTETHPNPTLDPCIDQAIDQGLT